MKKIKRSLIAVCILAVVISGFSVYATSNYFHTLVDELTFFKNASKWHYAVKDEDFNACYEDFQRIADLAKKHQNDVEESDRHWMMVGYDMNKRTYYISNKEKRIELNNQELESIEKITKEAFKQKDALFSAIYIYENRISFSIESYQYAVVYSMDDSKPTFVNSPNEGWKIYVKKIRDNWYHVTKNPE